MPPPLRTVQKLSAQLASLPKHKAGHFFSSFSEEESRAFSAYIAQIDDSDGPFGEYTAVVMRSKEAVFALAALPKEKQDAFVVEKINTLKKAVSMGNRDAETFAVGHKMQIDHLYPTTTAYGQGLQMSAKIIEKLGLADRDISKEQKDSQVMCAALLGFWGILHSMLQSCEGLIQTRWLKMTQAQRRQVLLIAWPDMPEGHRPDMEAFFNGKSFESDETDLRSFIWPYINLEDLLRPKALLIFLNSRGRNHPRNFAYSDLELAPMYKTRQEFISLLSKKHTMDFFGGENSMSYGAWIEWDDELKALESIRAGRTVHYEHGTQILNIQVTVLRFLVRCALHVLHDILWTHLPPAVPEPPKLSEQGEKIKRMEILAREAPYRLPARLDLRRMRTLVSTHRSQAIDHAWALREDPGYFASTIDKYYEHRMELIPDEFGNLHPHASDFPLYNKVARHMAADAHCLVFIFDELLQHIADVQDLLAQHSAELSVDKDLPSSLHEKLSELRYFLEAVMLNQVGDLSFETRASPPLRAYHYRANAHGPNLRLFDVRTVGVSAQDLSLNRLLALITAICSNAGRDCFTIHALLDEVERLMENDLRAKGFVSAHVAESLSRISIFAECLHQLHLFQPWAHKIETNVNDHKLLFAARYDQVFGHWGCINSNYQKFEVKSLNVLCSPRNGKFKYPAHEHPTRAKVQQMRSAEEALDAFWKAANAHWMQVVHTTPSALVEHIMGERELVRTQPWVPLVRTTKPKNALQLSGIASNAFPEHAHDVTKQCTGGFRKADMSIKSKKKTKGVVTSRNGCELLPTPAEAPSTTPEPMFKVDKRSLKAFRALFHSPDSPNQPGEVAWTELLHAMISLGFGAQKLRSSAWHFTPPASIAGRSIQLHEPHPDKKLPFFLARHCGRRLTIAYQWTSRSFELA